MCVCWGDCYPAQMPLQTPLPLPSRGRGNMVSPASPRHPHPWAGPDTQLLLPLSQGHQPQSWGILCPLPQALAHKPALYLPFSCRPSSSFAAICSPSPSFSPLCNFCLCVSVCGTVSASPHPPHGALPLCCRGARHSPPAPRSACPERRGHSPQIGSGSCSVGDWSLTHLP